MNEGINLLCKAAQAAAGCTVSSNTDVEYVEDCTLTDNSSVKEILEYIMLYMCKNLGVVVNAYKGGFMLTRLLPEYARLTHDIDFSISDKRQYEDVKTVLTNLGNILVAKGVFTSYELKEDIEERRSGGIKFVDKNGIKDFGVDVGLHDLSYGTHPWTFKGFDINIFDFERMLSDKISAIYSVKRFRRAKDLYDFYIITSNYDIDLSKLRMYIEQRGTIEWDRDPFREEVVTQYRIAYEKLKVRNIDGENMELEKPQFSLCLAQLERFMRGINNSRWNHDKKCCE